MSRKALLVVMVTAAVLAINLVGITDSEGFWPGGYWHHRGETPINWKVSGTIANVTFHLPSDTDPFFQLQPGILVSALTKGTPGNAQFIVTGWTGPPSAPGATSTECDPYPQLASLKNDMVVTFADQSMLFATLDPDRGGYVCAGPLPAVFNMIITGGTGRFEGAEGHFTGRFNGFPIGPPVSLPGALLAETGTIMGWIER